ncbi:hypothetical protein CAPTEDRAFT_187380 [Capitella teleta]|uniref:Uncharacterized protein n=1 Tax=Capitella teleta TaxID=283909 RepID=R7U0B3_CAPTE|nr:hypothetical protein CAPTEDRAFT_187380 [Capitella teleta]|eukprot:ELT96645.1 hypothetical protein CAPTEDRAFT_187380 [Capitella teleta]
MDKINRPPETDAPKPASFQGANVPQEIFRHGFVPFCVMSTLTVAILTFDLISDWLAWRSLNDFQLSELSPQHEPHFSGLRPVFTHFSVIYLSFCVVASAFALVELCRVLRLLVLQKRKLKESLDGVAYKRTSFDKHSGDIMLPLLVLAEDLPLSFLILALQLVTQCPVILPLPSHMILTSVCSSCLSLIWKIGQVIWRSGCCGQRTEFACSWSVSVLRAFSLLASLSALALTLLNLLLLTRPSFLPSNYGRLMRSVSYARWMQQDELSLVVRDCDDAIEGRVRMAQLELAVSPFDRSFIHPCDNTTLPFITHPAFNDSSSTQCQVLLQTSFSILHQVLFYDFSYRFFNSDVCHVGFFPPQITRLSNESISRNISLHLSLSPEVQPDWMKCNLEMARNDSMFEVFDPCCLKNGNIVVQKGYPYVFLCTHSATYVSQCGPEVLC